MSPEAVIAAYTGRWNIETTFEELRSFIGLETTRGWSRNTVLRAEPCLFGLYTVVVLAVRGACRLGGGGTGGRLARETRRHVLGRDHGGPALAVAGMGFRDPRSSQSLAETRGWIASDPVQCPWLRRHEIGRRPLRRPKNGMIRAVWCIGSFGVRAEPIAR